MHAFDVLGDPVRRRILELLSEGERPAGAIAEQVRQDFGISQAAVSQHLKVLRESGFAGARVEGPKRIYALQPDALHEVDTWLDQFRTFWTHRLEGLATEVARGKRARKPGDAED